MKNNNTKWVLGHLINPVQVSGNYDMVMGTTPASTQGPPPHLHNTYNEVFIVTKGEMQFVINNTPVTVKEGESIDLPIGTVHTFANNTDADCTWINIHSPKGFSSFFNDFGIESVDTESKMKSVDKAIIEKVIKTAHEYDMHIKM